MGAILCGIRLSAALGLAHGMCWLLARGLRDGGVRIRWWLATVAFCLPLAVLAPWWATHQLLVPTPAGIFPDEPKLGPHAVLSDTTYQFLPWEAEVRHALKRGQLPLWSDRLDGGSSLWVNPSAQVLSAIGWLGRFSPLQEFLLATLAVKLLIAFEGTFLLARRMAISVGAALCAGLAFTLGGGIMAWALFPQTSVAAWIPWVALSLICAVRAGDKGSLLATSATTALLLLGGHLEVALGGLALAAAMAFWYRRRKPELRRRLLRAAGALSLGVALAAVQLIPFTYAAHASERREDQETQAPAQFGPTSLSPSSWFAPAVVRFFLAPLGPEVFGRAYEGPFRGPWDWPDALAGYAGLVCWAGSAAALGSRARRRAAPLLLFALAAFAVSAQFKPLSQLALAVPLLHDPAYQRGLLAASLALALAGGLGLDRLCRNVRRGGISGWLLGACALALSADHSRTAVLLWTGIGVAVVLGRQRRNLGMGVLIAVSVLDLLPWSARLLPHGRPEGFFPPARALMSRLRALAGDPLQGRATGNALLAYPGTLPLYGIAEVRPNNPLAPKAYIHFLDAAFGFRPSLDHYYAELMRPAHPLLDFLAVRVVVSNQFLANPLSLGVVSDLHFGPYLLLTNPRAFPRAFFPRAAELVPPSDLGRWLHDLNDGAIVALDPSEGAGASSGGSIGFQGTWVRSSQPGHVQVAFKPAAVDRLLATSFLKEGWRAEADGRPLRTRTLDGCFVGIEVPRGLSTIELHYRPPGLLAGAAVSALALALVALGSTRAQRARRAPASHPRQVEQPEPAAGDALRAAMERATPTLQTASEGQRRSQPWRPAVVGKTSSIPC